MLTLILEKRKATFNEDVTQPNKRQKPNEVPLSKSLIIFNLAYKY